ncbi:hypothetical protein AVEN_87344-1 [Araneus ventricosus]|uniref:Uncharacterized protein n=1 Tax=Araneus ventricosus TaxID=182803 RepID=A0A4Y2L2W7_ARAVE|nr:hypothetical protein AVEN_87344-1 [Araneus ventricosus]
MRFVSDISLATDTVREAIRGLSILIAIGYFTRISGTKRPSHEIERKSKPFRSLGKVLSKTAVNDLSDISAGREVCLRHSSLISPKEISSQGLASIPRGLRTPVQVQNLASRSDFSIFPDLENRVPNLGSISQSILHRSSLFISKTPNYKLLSPVPMRSGRKFKSQGFVGWLTPSSNH